MLPLELGARGIDSITGALRVIGRHRWRCMWAKEAMMPGPMVRPRPSAYASDVVIKYSAQLDATAGGIGYIL